MYVVFEIHGSLEVPRGTRLVDGSSNLFRLPTGQIVSVHPVIEMASAADSDDHRDLTTSEATAVGVRLDLYERESSLLGDS
ncbi:hypothetical protein EBBID32_16570 [Sphingobium indicum BiD32]|uniref:Uncharacterized protein n=1 Tax=Sphingobium indicum BiD32 TaxID=1301087 RepID=N1MPE4_9SPHN|nr:hypothetical protein [Sphingobium indicum]CCW17318.1 hypothetical protein EBBID32_16570 [Sphingobium indicum BiD32]